MFISCTAESYDPQPWFHTCSGARAAEPEDMGDGKLDCWAYEPRPEFEPTRDEFPWWVKNEFGDGRRREPRERGVALRNLGYEVEWDPRDRNRNRILIALRDPEQWDFDDYIAEMPERIERQLDWINDNPDLPAVLGFTPAEVEHARKVLTRLAARATSKV